MLCVVYCFGVLCSNVLYVCNTYICTFINLSHIFIVFSHHKFDSSHPGICFLGDPWQENVTSDGGTISWQEIGFEMHIPPGAVPEEMTMKLRVRPCLSGPFHLPREHQLASPVYLITPAFEFIKDVRLSIAHFAGLDSSSDCDSMTFITSSSKPKYDPQAKYVFNVLSGGIFKKKEHHGVIYLKHFCLTGAAKQTSATSDAGAQSEARNGNYARKLNTAVFHKTSLHHIPPQYLLQILSMITLFSCTKAI